jgi:hypothetical protein
VLSGAATPEHLRSNARALALARVSDLRELVQPTASYWSERAAMSWN